MRRRLLGIMAICVLFLAYLHALVRHPGFNPFYAIAIMKNDRLSFVLSDTQNVLEYYRERRGDYPPTLDEAIALLRDVSPNDKRLGPMVAFRRELRLKAFGEHRILYYVGEYPRVHNNVGAYLNGEYCQSFATFLRDYIRSDSPDDS